MLRPCLWSRLSCQLDSLAPILSDAPENIIVAPGSARSWSAHHHLAHLGRLHEVMLERIRRVLCEDDPLIAEYRTEDDTETLQWTALSTRELLARLQAVRGELLGQVRGLSEEQLRRGAIDPRLGRLPLAVWLERFCLHEAHHLHLAWERIAEAMDAARGTSPAA